MTQGKRGPRKPLKRHPLSPENMRRAAVLAKDDLKKAAAKKRKASEPKEGEPEQVKVRKTVARGKAARIESDDEE